MQASSKNIFDTVPEKRYLDLYEEEAIQPQKVVKFLAFTKADVASAADTPIGNVRYDQRIPEELKRYLTEVAVVCENVANFFGGDTIKTSMWFQTSNPLLGNISPRDMIRLGRFRKLMKFIQNSLSENRP
jgi:hypothetical protein